MDERLCGVSYLLIWIFFGPVCHQMCSFGTERRRQMRVFQENNSTVAPVPAPSSTSVERADLKVTLQWD